MDLIHRNGLRDKLATYPGYFTHAPKHVRHLLLCVSAAATGENEIKPPRVQAAGRAVKLAVDCHFTSMTVDICRSKMLAKARLGNVIAL